MTCRVTLVQESHQRYANQCISRHPTADSRTRTLLSKSEWHALVRYAIFFESVGLPLFWPVIGQSTGSSSRLLRLGRRNAVELDDCRVGTVC